jgi:hypothetical protein
MNGVEIAQSDGNIVYLAMRTSAGAPLLARSTDAGAHFTVNDLSASLGTGLLRIIAVDPQDPNRVLMRFLGTDNQSLALTVDGGTSATKPVTINGDFNSFTWLPSGTSWSAAWSVLDEAGLFRSHDQYDGEMVRIRPRSGRCRSGAARSRRRRQLAGPRSGHRPTRKDPAS